MYLEGVGVRKRVLCVGKLDAYIKVWQPTDEVCRRKTGLDVSCPQFAQTKCSVKQGWMLENLMLASKFDNLRTKFAEGSIERLEHISTPLILKWIKGVSKIIKNKLINTEVPDKLENIEILEIDENKG